MESFEPVLLNYVFLDVEGFSKRFTEAQADIVHALNSAVLEGLSANGITREGCIFLPTGDGMCIAVRALTPLDIQVKVALSILAQIETYNSTQSKANRQFKVRVGVHRQSDIVVTDINGHTNVAGSGINFAARVMSCADGGNVLVSDTVYHELSSWETYDGAFRTYETTVKHGQVLNVHQLITCDCSGLETAPPRRFRESPTVTSPLSRRSAWYMAMAIKYRPLVLKHRFTPGLAAWLWIKAHDQLVIQKAAGSDEEPLLFGDKPQADTDGEQLALCLTAVPLGWRFVLDDFVKNELGHESFFDDSVSTKLNADGYAKLKADHVDLFEWAHKKEDEEQSKRQDSVLQDV